MIFGRTNLATPPLDNAVRGTFTLRMTPTPARATPESTAIIGRVVLYCGPCGRPTPTRDHRGRCPSCARGGR